MKSLRTEIAEAIHERWCGSPPSCGVKRGHCEGMADAKTLDAVMAVIKRRIGQVRR